MFDFQVTEQEIYHGIINQLDSNKRSIVFMREFEDYNEMIVNKINEKKLKKY